MIQFQVTSLGNNIAQGQTTNPYQVRNLLRQYLEAPIHQLTPHDLITHSGLRIWCSSDLTAIMQDTPIIRNNQHKETPRPVQPQIEGPTASLRDICHRIRLHPTKARRILRKKYGAQKLRYEWPVSQVQDIINLLRSK